MNGKESKLLHADLTERIIQCYYDVYNELGYGFLESVYHEAMVLALREKGMAVESKVEIPVFFRGQRVGVFEADVFVEHLVALEFKAVESLHAAHESQLLNYLKATSIEIGFLMNFGTKPTFKRFLFDNERKQSRPSINPS